MDRNTRNGTGVLGLVALLAGSDAHAQRIPEILVWSAGLSLLAPFIAVPVKLGVLRLVNLKAGTGRLWAFSAVEWLLWFLVGGALVRFGGLPSAPLVVAAVLVLMVWLHRVGLETRWRNALLLSLPTPLLAGILPLLAFGVAVLLDEYVPGLW